MTFEESGIVTAKSGYDPGQPPLEEHSHGNIIRPSATMIWEGQITMGTTIWIREAPINLSVL